MLPQLASAGTDDWTILLRLNLGGARQRLIRFIPIIGWQRYPRSITQVPLRYENLLFQVSTIGWAERIGSMGYLIVDATRTFSPGLLRHPLGREITGAHCND